MEKEISNPEETEVKETEVTEVTEEEGTPEEIKEEQEEKPEGEDKPPEPKPVNKTEKYIKTLRQQKYEALREAEYWKNQAVKEKKEELKEIKQERPQRPDIAKFKDEYGEIDYSKYNNAVTHYEDELETWRETSRLEKQRQDSLKTNIETAQKNFKKHIETASEKYEDFDEVAFADDIPYNDITARLVMESEIGGDIAYYFGKNPDFAHELTTLSYEKAAKEIGKLEAKLTAVPLKKTVSQANEPIKPLKGSEGTFLPKDPSKMTDSEWFEWDKKQKIKKLSQKGV